MDLKKCFLQNLGFSEQWWWKFSSSRISHHVKFVTVILHGLVASTLGLCIPRRHTPQTVTIYQLTWHYILWEWKFFSLLPVGKYVDLRTLITNFIIIIKSIPNYVTRKFIHTVAHEWNYNLSHMCSNVMKELVKSMSCHLSTSALVPKVCCTDPKGSATTSKGIFGYISLMATILQVYWFLKSGKCCTNIIVIPIHQEYC